MSKPNCDNNSYSISGHGNVKLKDVRLVLPSLAGDVEILNGIDLSVEKGQTVGLVGPSGAGKSTLMMVIAGLEKPTSGVVEVGGVDVTKKTEDQLALFRRKNVGIVFQDFHLVPTMTALENVAIPLEFAKEPEAFGVARTQLEKVGLGHRLEHYPGQLSGGEQQRVALARAFAVRPALLLADEPTGNLDGPTSDKVMDLLFDLQKETGTTLILITHDMELASRCERIVTVEDGKIAADTDKKTEL